MHERESKIQHKAKGSCIAIELCVIAASLPLMEVVSATDMALLRSPFAFVLLAFNCVEASLGFVERRSRAVELLQQLWRWDARGGSR